MHVIQLMKAPLALLFRLLLGPALLCWTPPVAIAEAIHPAATQVPTLAPIVRETTPAVVNISVRGRVREDNPLYRDPLFREFFDLPKQVEKEIHSAGSGVIVDASRGYVLTANHVMSDFNAAQITTKDGRKFPARLVGRDAATDVALLQLQGANALKAMPLGDSDRLEVGDYVIAIGNPFGIGQTVTSGIISALGRTGLGKQGYEDLIQTDAAINPGNSGGALVNLRGQLIGLNAAIISPGGGNVGIGFAVPINTARRVMEQLGQYGMVHRGQIGVSARDIAPEQAMKNGRTEGALIANLVQGSPAELAGLRSGDIVIAVDGAPVRSAAQLRNRIGLAPVNTDVRLGFERQGRQFSAEVRIAPIEPSGRPKTSAHAG